MRGFGPKIAAELKGMGDFTVQVNASFDPGKVKAEAQAAADAAKATVKIDADITALKGED
jgi:hypothetical protein